MINEANIRFRSVFKNRHVVLPVIHVDSEEQALRNTEIAREAGADGVFLINHGMGSEELLRIHDTVSKKFPGWWMGVNCLDLHPTQVFKRVPASVAGVWTDNAMVDEHRISQPQADLVLAAQQAAGWKGLYFGGVAFKYQREVNDLTRASQTATRYMDVVTTSGPGTGKAAAVEKIRVMKKAIGNFPLAIASGITPENIDEYLPYADCFLVATGISSTFEELDPDRVRELVECVRAFSTTAGVKYD